MEEEREHAAEYRFSIQITIEGQSTCGQSTLDDQMYRLFREAFSEVAWHGRCIESGAFKRVTSLKLASTKMIPSQAFHAPTTLIA